MQSRQQIESERVAREQEVREAQIQSKLTVATFETEADGKIENARLLTQNEVETARVNTEKSIELANVESERMVRITAQEARSEFERAEVTRSLIVETERLRMEEEVRARDIERQHKIKMAETASYREVEDARVVADREIEELRTAARRYIERFDIEQQMETELADKARLIAELTTWSDTLPSGPDLGSPAPPPSVGLFRPGRPSTCRILIESMFSIGLTCSRMISGRRLTTPSRSALRRATAS